LSEFDTTAAVVPQRIGYRLVARNV